jgi:hypothetical protein
MDRCRLCQETVAAQQMVARFLGSHFLGRALREQGHEVRLIPSQLERFQVRTFGAPQPLLAAQTFVQRNGLQLIHDARAGLYHAVP